MWRDLQCPWVDYEPAANCHKATADYPARAAGAAQAYPDTARRQAGDTAREEIMVASNFPKSLAFVLKDEGGDDDDPQDHGGRTSRGITQREYTAWRAEKGSADLDVWKAPQGDIDLIYKEEYYLPEGDWLPSGLDYLLFDMKVNAGPHRAIVLLQRALGVNDDGRIGPITRQAIAAADPKTLIAAYTEAKRAFYRSLHQPRFLKGWLNRCNNVQSNAMTMLSKVATA